MTDKHTEYNPDDESMPEGVEAPPPLTHTMAIVRWAILIGMTLFALTMVLSYFGATPWSRDSAGVSQYHCPMHPTYVSSQPGDCPICGMSLVPINSKVDVDSATKAEHGNQEGEAGKVSVAKPGQYYCPMDPEIASDTEGKCSMCGMFLEKFEPGMKFTCEMHPEVVTDRPGDCPKCGMDLIPLEATSSQSQVAPESALRQSPVPGLVPVTIEPQRLQLIGVRTATVTRRSLSSATQLVGYIAPDESKITNLTVRVSGWVQKLNVNETGQTVSKGQPLLTLYSQDLYQAEQDFLLSYAMSGQASGDSALSDTRHQILDAARERLRLMGLTTDEINELESAGKAQSEIPLRSPYDGVVLEKAVFDGQFVTPDQRLFTIADLRTIWVLADVYEADLAAVKIGQPATMTITAYPDEQFTGRVSFIYPTVSEQTRTLKVRAEFANPGLRLRPGMYAQVSLAGGPDDVLAISREAVMDGGDIAYAFVVHDGTHFEPRLITVGRSTGDFVEVKSGLHEGETVVTSANFLIDSESRLKAAISGMGGTQADPHAGHGK